MNGNTIFWIIVIAVVLWVVFRKKKAEPSDDRGPNFIVFSDKPQPSRYTPPAIKGVNDYVAELRRVYSMTGNFVSVNTVFIGNKINDSSGHQMMADVCDAIQEKLGVEAANNLESQWLGIGGWQGRTKKRSAQQPAKNSWIQFDHPQSLFSLSYPGGWQQVMPVSDMAALSCKVKKGEKGLFEVICLHSDVDRGPNQPCLTDIIADGMAENSPGDWAADKGRLISRREIFSEETSAGKIKCVRVIITFLENGMQLITDHFAIGSEHDGLHIAFKADEQTYKSERENFEKVYKTLKTPWFRPA